MALSVDFCDDTDFYRIFSIVSDAFGDDQPYIDAIFPSHHEHSGRIKGGERLLEMKRTDSTNRFLKATDTSTGEIIGLAKYIIFANGKPEESPLGGDLWKTTDEKEYAAQLYEQYLEPRRKVVRSADGPVIALDILTIDPNHQRRGAGRELMKWGVRMADEIGAEMTVEASIFGRHLYEQNGFRVTDNISIEVPEKWANKPKVEFMFMRRLIARVV